MSVLGKSEMRASALALRRRATPSTQLLVDLLTQRHASCITAFVSMPSEPDTTPLRAALTELRVALPVLHPDKSLSWVLESDEPISLTEVDVMVVPALAIDAAGRRLGRGGGSYDRAIAEFRRAQPDGLVVAWVSEADLVDEVPVEAHDEPVDAAVSEARVLWFRLSTL